MSRFTIKYVIVQMGCYGLGLSRILAASVEVLSNEKELRWPDAIVPFTVCIVCPKNGSREAEVVGETDLQIYDLLVDELNLVSSTILRSLNSKISKFMPCIDVFFWPTG